jgi:hypothetical protein
LHHCFLPEKTVIDKGWNNDIYDKAIKPTAQTNVCWNGSTGGDLNADRIAMIQTVRDANGVAVFVGNIVDGVKDEYDICKDYGIGILQIDL